jgi:hypothetical protein
MPDPLAGGDRPVDAGRIGDGFGKGPQRLTVIGPGAAVGGGKRAVGGLRPVAGGQQGVASAPDHGQHLVGRERGGRDQRAPALPGDDPVAGAQIGQGAVALVGGDRDGIGRGAAPCPSS